MENELENSLVKELEKHGLAKDGKIEMSESDIRALKMGNMTDLVELKNINGEDGFKIDSVKARLSVVSDGKRKRLRKDPIYKEIQNHPLLESKEQEDLINGKVANVKKTSSIAKNQPWNEKSHVIEYDPQTRQFMDYDPQKLRIPEQINGDTLSAEKKRELREGEVITLTDGTQVQIRTSDKNGLRSNRSSLVLSILIDGGLSYLLVTGVKKLIGAKSQEDKSYSRGYLEALWEVEKQLERKQKRFPKDKSIANEVNVVKQELSNALTMSQDLLNNRSKKDVDDIKGEKSIGDPDYAKEMVENREDKGEVGIANNFDKKLPSVQDMNEDVERYDMKTRERWKNGRRESAVDDLDKEHEHIEQQQVEVKQVAHERTRIR